MLDKILSKMDESVFTEDVKEELHESFNTAVETKASFLVEEKIEELEAKEAQLDEAAQKHIEFLEESAEEYVELKQQELLESLDLYLDKVVDSFVSEAKEALDSNISAKEAELVKEAFESVLSTTGKEFQKTVLEGADETIQEEIAMLKENYNEAVKEVFELQKTNDALLSTGVINEIAQDLTLIEAKRFKRLAESVEFSKDEKYLEKLEDIKESVQGFTEEKLDTTLNENTQSKKPKGALFNFSHLV